MHPGPDTLLPPDFLWSITVWGPGLLDDDLVSRLDRVQLEPAHLSPARPARTAARAPGAAERWRTAGGMLQYRFLFGSELRNERVHIDTPLAEQLGLRSTNLQFRA